MYRPGCGRSSRSKDKSSSGARCSRSGASTSGSNRGRSPRRSRSPSPRGRRHSSPSSSRSSRRSPSPRRCSRRRSPGWRSHSPHRRSPSRHSESSVEQNLQITVGNDRYGIDTPERKRLCDRLGSPVDSLSDRDDLADGPIFSRSLSRPRSLERYSSREENQSSPFIVRHDEDYRNRDVFVHHSDYSMNYEDHPRETDRDGELLRKSLYTSEDRGREPKRPRSDRDDRLLDMSIEPQGFLPGTRKYRKRTHSRSPSPAYLDEDFRELESARRKRKEEELSRNLSRELSGSSYILNNSTNLVQSSEHRYLYRPDEAPAMPKKSILKKRVDDHSVQPEVFSSTSSSVKEPQLLSNHHPLPQRSNIPPFSLEVENFLKQFNKNAVAESASKESQGNEHDWRPYSGLQQNTFSFKQNSENFLKQKETQESTLDSVDQHGDFLLPHERASQDGSGFSRILGILGVMADSSTSQEKRRRSFPDDIEDEEKFLYGDDDDDCNISSPSTQKITLSDGKEPVSQKVSSPPPLSSSVKSETSEESRPEYEKIHNLLKTIGLDIGVAEIGKLAARTQERLHGKKSSRSPDHYSVASKSEKRERHRNQNETHSPDSSQKHTLSPSGSFSSSKVMPSISKSERSESKSLGQDNSANPVEQPVPPISLIPSAPPSLPNLPSTPSSVSQYRVSRFPPFTPTQLPQNYPPPTMAPPGYDAYGHYMAYAASGWPMYAQQADPALTDVHGLVTLSVPPNPTRPNLRVIETVSTGKGTPFIKRDESVLVQIPTAAPYSKVLPHCSQPSLRGSKERSSDEKNRASQKQKVIEEREKLKAEQEARQKKLHYLRAELNRLSKQQGELLRKKRREKDGHKDPLLIEVNRLQENIMKEIAQLKISADAGEKKQSELDKVAQILGINIFEKSQKLSSENKDSSEKIMPEIAKIQEKTSNPVKDSDTTSDKPKGKSPKPTECSSQPSKQQFQGTNIYDYYDTGNHWCKDCNTICGTMFDFFTHMHNKKHRQTLDPYNRPWASKTQTETKQEVTKRIDKIPVPAKGSEFLIPVTGYYCQLCNEFFGDQISAEQHVKRHLHNEKYKKYMDENPLYEERRNLDRQAGLYVIQETERRLKRKLCEKQKEEKDEQTTKVAKKEELKKARELEDGNNEQEINKRKEIPNGEKCGIKLKLKKDGKEVEKKEEKKEESEKDSRLATFGKFSWRKTERDEKYQGKDTAVSKEENTEEGKESKSQSGKPNSKPIAIKLSGKTVIPHTSPWTPVVSTSSQAKIRPNLPVPMMVLRKTAVATVSKPAPLNTFLSIKSSGATTKPLPVVKEGNPEIVLPPDIISKAFGGEVVVLKGSQEDIKLPEKTEEREHESVTKAVDQAKTLEHANSNTVKAQEQAVVVAKAQAKARELAALVKEQEVLRTSKVNEQSPVFERPHRRPPLLPLPPGPPLSHPLSQPPSILFAFPPPFPPKQTVILADDMAPGVSEDDKNILAMPMCPRPSPPPTIFGDHVKKLEKKNSSLATGNAKDLYDIFYNSSGRSPAESKLVNSTTSDKGKLNSVEREKNSELQVNSKLSNNSFAQELFCKEDISSAKTPETVEVKDEKMITSEENTENKMNVEQDIEKTPFSDIQSMLSESDDLATSTSFPFHNEEEIGIPAPPEFNKKSPDLERTVLDVPIRKTSPLSLDGFSEKSVDLEAVEHKVSDDQLTTQFLESPGSKNLLAAASASMQNEVDIKTSPAEFNMTSELEKGELTMHLTESSVPHLKYQSKNPSELETEDFKTDSSKLDLPLSDNSTVPLEDSNKKLSEIAELPVQLPDSNDLFLRDGSKNPLDIGIEEFKIPDNKKIESSIAPLDVINKQSELESVESAMLLLEDNAHLKTCSETLSELETARDQCPDENKLAMHLSEDSIGPIEDISKKPSECERAESTCDKELIVQLIEEQGNSSRESGVMSYASATGTEDISDKSQNQQKIEVYDNSSLEEGKSDLDMKACTSNLNDKDMERKHLVITGCHSAVSQGDDSPLFDMPVENPQTEGPTVAEEKQIYDSSEPALSRWVSDTCAQSQLFWELLDSSSKLNKENTETIVPDSYSKESSLELKLDTEKFNKFESAISDKSAQTSEIQNSDSELKTLNKHELDSLLTNNEHKVLNGSQLKDSEDFSVVNVLEPKEIANESFVNITMISTTVGKYEQINNFSLSCEAKELEVEGSEAFSSTDEIKPTSMELMFIKHDAQISSNSDLELSDTAEREFVETESANFTSIQPEVGQESLVTLPAEISVGHLGEVALSFTDMNSEVLNTSEAGNFDLNNTYSELNFEQPTPFTLNLNVDHEEVSPKSDETKPTDFPRLKPSLELETMELTLKEHKRLGILPTEILKEDNADSPKLETITPLCLEAGKTTDQPAVESEMINFAALTPDYQEEKFCSVVLDAVIPHVVSSASKDDMTNASKLHIQLQDTSSVSNLSQPHINRGDTSDKLLWTCENDVQNQTATCMESILPELKESVEVGGPGDSELYSVKNQMETSIVKLMKAEEENNERRCEVKKTSKVTDKSAEHLLL